MLPGGGQLARCIHRLCLTLLVDDDGFLCHLRPYVVEEFAEGGIALAFLQLLEQEIGEESVALLPVRIGRLVALCRTYHQHVSPGSLSLRRLDPLKQASITTVTFWEPRAWSWS